MYRYKIYKNIHCVSEPMRHWHLNTFVTELPNDKHDRLISTWKLWKSAETVT